MAHAAVAHLGDMEKPRLFQSDVDECAEVRDVAYRSFEDGANGEIGELYNVLTCERRGQILARITPGTCNCLEDVRDGRNTRAEFLCKRCCRCLCGL